MAGIKKGGPKRGLKEAIKKRRRGRGPYAGVPLSKRPPPSPTPPGIGDDYGGGSDPGNGWDIEHGPPPWGGAHGGKVELFQDQIMRKFGGGRIKAKKK